MGIAQNGERSVPGIGHSHFRRIGQITGGTGSQQIVLVLTQEMGSRFPYIGRVFAGEMGAVVTGDIGVIIGQISTDGLGMNPLKIIIGFTIRGHGQVKITAIHVQRAQSFSYFGVGPQEVVGHQNGFGLLVAGQIHDFQPGNPLAGTLVINDVGTVHLSSGVQR